MDVSSVESNSGTLFVVATPIGNLDDITVRAIRTLQEVDFVASEDTRRTRTLLNHLGISKPTLSYYREKEQRGAEEIVHLLNEGKDVALVSDAGTPCVSDPGTILVRRALLDNLKVVPIPGVSALVTGLSVSGLVEGSFLFLGFLPNGKGPRRKLLTSLRTERHALAFYESPKRIVATLSDLATIFVDRQVFVARELTKIHEEYFSGTAQEIVRKLSQKERIKGEFVVYVAPDTSKVVPESSDIQELILWYRESGNYSLSETSKIIAKDIGVSRSAVYAEALKIW